jgi:hypothetical protein
VLSAGDTATHSKKYSPQLEAPPTRFGTRPRYSPFHPSAWTASARALYTPVPSRGFVRVDDEGEADEGERVVLDDEAVLGPAADDDEEDARGVSASWKRTLTRSRGCITSVATVPAPKPATAWSCDQSWFYSSRGQRSCDR